jgi:hypothetical protein
MNVIRSNYEGCKSWDCYPSEAILCGVKAGLEISGCCVERFCGVRELAQFLQLTEVLSINYGHSESSFHTPQNCFQDDT